MPLLDMSLSEHERQLLHGLIGKTLDSILTDVQGEDAGSILSSFGFVGLTLDGDHYAIESDVVPEEFFGEPEDVANLTFRRLSHDEEIKPHLVGMPRKTTAVGKRVRDVLVHDELEQERLGDRGFKKTAALVFEFDDTELTIATAIWFSEDFEIAFGSQGKVLIPSPGFNLEEGEVQNYETVRAITRLSDGAVETSLSM